MRQMEERNRYRGRGNGVAEKEREHGMANLFLMCCRAGQGNEFLCGRNQSHPGGEPQLSDHSELHAPKEMGST